MTLSPAKLNLICQLMCDDWGITNTKLKYCQCTSAALLCCKNTQLFNCIWQILTYEWWIWIVLFIPRCYKTSLSSGGCFCAFEILVALTTKQNLVAVVYMGNLPTTLKPISISVTEAWGVPNSQNYYQSPFSVKPLLYLQKFMGGVCCRLEP